MRAEVKWEVSIEQPCSCRIDPEYFVHHCIPSSQNRAWQLTDVYWMNTWLTKWKAFIGVSKGSLVPPNFKTIIWKEKNQTDPLEKLYLGQSSERNLSLWSDWGIPPVIPFKELVDSLIHQLSDSHMIGCSQAWIISQLLPPTICVTLVILNMCRTRFPQ